jgi:hypothetical protein
VKTDVAHRIEASPHGSRGQQDAEELRIVLRRPHADGIQQGEREESTQQGVKQIKHGAGEANRQQEEPSFDAADAEGTIH